MAKGKQQSLSKSKANETNSHKHQPTVHNAGEICDKLKPAILPVSMPKWADRIHDSTHNMALKAKFNLDVIGGKSCKRQTWLN